MTDRIYSLDSLKGVALLFVVFIHSKPFFSSNSKVSEFYYVVDNFSRIAVPAFFLTSGYLLSQKIGNGENPDFVKRQLSRIGKYYVFASIAYLPILLALIHLNTYLDLAVIDSWVNLHLLGLDGLINLLYTGKAIAPFLWFLPALFFSIVTIYFFHCQQRMKILLVGSLLLHVLAILSNTYLLLDQLAIPVEDSLFFGLFFTTSGFYIGRRNLKDWQSGRTFLGLTVVFLILNLLERWVISFTVQPWDTYYWGLYFWGPYSFFTAPMVICPFLYVLKNPDWGRGTRFKEYGRYTLGGYILHPLVIGGYVGLSIVFAKITGFEILGTAIWDFLLFPLAYVTTMEATIEYRHRLGA